MYDRFINLFTDYGFKKIFGEEPNKDLLIGFLNELLEGEHIKDLIYLKNERLGKNEKERRAVYDLYCSNERGEKFIVEVQRVKQQFFKDRSVYYSTFAIQEQAVKGQNWKYELKGVYTIGILDFVFDDNNYHKLHHHVQLMETRTKEVFYGKLTFIYLEIPKFSKQLHELENDYERWLFAFKNLHKLAERPKELEEGIFAKLLALAEISQMDKQEQAHYQDSLKEYWDLKSAMDTYYADGKEEGRKLGLQEGERARNIEIARNALRSGLDIELITRLTGLSEQEVKAIGNS